MTAAFHSAPWAAFARISLLGLLLLTLSACGLNRQLSRQAELLVATTQAEQITCLRSDHCAIASPFSALADQARQRSSAQTPAHYVTLLEQGEESLLARIHLIRAARERIDIQTFIWAEDDAGWLLLDELLTAARRGVKVRIIADQLFSLDNTRWLAQLARAHRNLEVRIYNPTFHRAVTSPLAYAASIVCCFTRFNQRMHNKLFLVDGTYGIAGGRNHENRYFDWDQTFDYRDRDVLVIGPEAGRQMNISFTQFWNYKRAQPLTRLNDVNKRLIAELDDGSELQLPENIDWPRVEHLRARALDPVDIHQTFIEPTFRVSQVDYFSDRPDKQDSSAIQEPILGDRIAKLIASAKDQIVLQTPYLVLSQPARELFRELHARRPAPQVIVSTNSLASTDAFYVYALSHKYKKRYLKLGFRIFEFKPFPADARDLIANYEVLSGGLDADGYQRHGRAPLTRDGVRLGMHAKSIVIDNTITLIGSHNFDPRSDNYNTESGFIIYDHAVAERVRAEILRDTQPQNAWTIAKRPRTNLLQRINNALADFSTALPLFDFWPLRYATSYELDPGCSPLPITDPDFYDCYTSVGDFPEVDLPLKTIYTRMVTAFGAGAAGIL
ncbi:MAG: phospholipase D family protein [Dokdonella sp.]